VEPDRVLLRAPELVRPRLEVLDAGLKRMREGDGEGIGTVRRMGKVFLNWAIGEGLEGVEKAAFGVVRAKDSELLEAGETLKALLEEFVSRLGPSDSERLSVLVVEDNPDDVALLEVALRAADRMVHVVSTGAEAEEVLAKEEVALLVMDLQLPDTDGRTLLSHFRILDQYKDLTIFIVSGKSGPEVKAECLALGANAFFDKPVNPTLIAAAASSSLHREAQRRLGSRNDPLTHLLNRSSIRGLWERWTFPAPSSIGIIGLDHFEALEDRFDHEVTDRVVASVGMLLRESVPRGCVSARWDESEFLVLCPGLDRDTATGILQKILAGLKGLDHPDPRGETFRVTGSGGVVEIEKGSSLDDAVEEAHSLLTNAMEAGGNTLAQVASAEKVVSVLVAEDDPLSAGILLHRLEKEGFHVLHYPDGAQALEGALSNRIDLAILDVKMPGMDGFELLERLRKVPAYYELPIMMLTSMGREEDIARGFKLGADDYMVKPFSPVEVLARVRRLLSR
jgi:two-component system cell cycle response regulator